MTWLDIVSKTIIEVFFGRGDDEREPTGSIKVAAESNGSRKMAARTPFDHTLSPNDIPLEPPSRSPLRRNIARPHPH